MISFDKLFVTRKDYKDLIHRLNRIEKAINDLPDDSISAATKTKAKRIVVKKSSQEEDLTVVKGIGKVIQSKLYDMGITRLSQLAGLSVEEVSELEDELNLYDGRIARENWVEQARKLLSS